MSYDSGNIFAKILRGEIPCHKVYEDAAALAFMDVMPMVDGHTLVIPKAASRNLLDADPQVLGETMAVVQRIARAAVLAFGADGVQIRQYNEPAAGQTVFHLHFHILPLRDGDAIRPHTGQMASHELLAQHAERLRQALGSVFAF